MELQKLFIPFLAGVAIVACGIVTYQIGRAGGYQRGYDDALSLPHKADTVWRTDTHYVDHPVEVVKWKDREKLVYISLKDTIEVSAHDTTFIALERETKGYSGDDYQAQVSGVGPSLDWIKVFPKTAYITNTVVEKKRWTFGAAVGPGAFWNGGQPQFGVGAVVGLQYRF